MSGETPSVWLGDRNCSGRYGEEINLFPLPGIEIRLLCYRVRGLVTFRLKSENVWKISSNLLSDYVYIQQSNRCYFRTVGVET